MKYKLIQETVTGLMRLKDKFPIFLALSKNASKALSRDNKPLCTNYKDPCSLFTAPILQLMDGRSCHMAQTKDKVAGCILKCDDLMGLGNTSVHLSNQHTLDLHFVPLDAGLLFTSGKLSLPLWE